ncbi:MAG: nucleotide sugar dehydrogenase [Planctomycetes bacterium]|nr:nucleotide sugar dehydrogenase [Planctomycetota bacterium]
MPSGAVTPRSVSVVGLGKLGAPIAACLAARGFEVWGVDTDARRVEAVSRGEAVVYEPGLEQMQRDAAGRLHATTDLAQAVRDTDLSMLIVPTPSDADGTFSLRFILPACRTIGQAIKNKATYHLVIITSTVMPGATGGVIRDAIEQASGRACGDRWGLCYSPEFVALGSVIKDFLNPDFILIGQHDERSGDGLEAVYRKLHGDKVPVSRLNLVNAELAKIAVNTFITTKITFANMLAGICQNLPGAGVDEVTQAIGLDSRIGRKYLRGAIGYGGPCFPRDNRAMAALAHDVNASAALAESVDRENRLQVRRLVELVRQHLPEGGHVGVLGLAYKPDTDVVEQSQGLLLAAALADEGVRVTAYDPAAMANAKSVLGGDVRFAGSMDDCVRVADVLAVVTPWNEFRGLDAETLRRAGGPRTVIDCWRVLDRKLISDAARWVGVGVGPAEKETAADAARALRVA